jgi:large subunit ribosomal protein L25
MKQIELNATERTLVKKKVKELRDKGLLPAGIFGISGNRNITINKKEFIRVFKEARYTGIINIQIEGKNHNVLITEIQTHPILPTPLHVSFHEVSLKEKVTAAVPIELIGEAPAVKLYGGVIFENLQEIEISSLPQNIPPSIEIDISGLLNIGDSILIKDLVLPDDIELVVLDEEEFEESTVVTISAPQAEEIEEEVEEVSPDDIEVIGEKKDGEGEGEKTDSKESK